MALADLAPAFTLGDARAVGFSKDQIYDLLAREEIERVGRGVFIRTESLEPALTPLAAATVRRADATLCLTSALVHHQLSDAIPFESDIALPRGAHHPEGLPHIGWHSFDPETFAIGREKCDAGGIEVAIYSAERTIVDCFRLMHREGSEVAYEALRRWLRRRGSTPANLLEVAHFFPKALPRIGHALEVLL